MKICSKCGVEKMSDQFHRKAKARDGLSPTCKQCIKAASSDYYERNKEGVCERVREYAAARPAEMAAARKKRYDADPEASKARSLRWARSNPARRAEIAAKSAAKNRENKRRYHVDYMARKMAENPEAVREQNRRAQAIRRSRIAGAGGHVPRDWWKAILDVFETSVCIYCGDTTQALTVDHWMPVKLGGPTEVGNLIPCCKSCNSKKRDMHPDEWAARIGDDAFNFARTFLAASKDAFLGINVEVVK